MSDGGRVIGFGLIFVAQVFAQFAEQQPGIDQLHFALAIGGFVVAQEPDVGGDAGVVKEVVGQFICFFIVKK